MSSEDMRKTLYFCDKAAAIARDVLAENLGDLTKSLWLLKTLDKGDQFHATEESDDIGPEKPIRGRL